MRRNPSSPTQSAPGRAGFTLVEMLVATALVVLIMLMFAQIFGMATTTMSRQKGMAELDQAGRTLASMLSADIHYRTFRDVMPFRPGQDTTNPGPNYVPDRRRGYFYISENDPNNDTDDVLQFTIQTNNAHASTGSPFPRLGKAQRNDPFLYGRAIAIPPGIPNSQAGIAGEPNQVEYDDGVQSANRTGQSTYAEVSYFLRNGNLYRRVLLVRSKYDGGGTEEPAGPTGDYDSTDLLNPEPGDGQSFWRDFDYSAFYSPSAITPGIRFHTSASMGNSSNDPSVDGLVPLSLGVPHLRFGHTLHTNSGGPSYGIPREFLDDSTSPPTGFIGRFTMQETSHSEFGYPGRIPVDPNPPNDPLNPMDRATPLTFDGNYLVSQLSNETHRRGDDLLLTNVHEFDVEVWDNGLTPPRFVDLGHGITGGQYEAQARNPQYGNRFDTWHPGLPNPDPNYSTPYFPTTDGTYTGVQVGASIEDWLRGIRIRVRYLDVSTGQMRQLTREFDLTQ